MKPTLVENFEEEIAVEEYLHTIGVIMNDESTKDSKGTSKRAQAYESKPRKTKQLILRA